MENYNLKADEVVLYKGSVILNNRKGTTELILTNTNLVFINKYKPLFSKEEVTILEHQIQSIKIYEGVPQIKSTANTVEIQLLEQEIEFEFYSKMELLKFTNATNKLLTGESTIQKGAKKVKDAIGLIDDTLGINTVESTTNVIKNGLIGSVSGVIGKIGKSLFDKNKK